MSDLTLPGAGEASGSTDKPAAASFSALPSVDRLLGAAEAELGAVDILVNNAGVSSSAPLRSLELEEWNRLMAVNATGTFLCTRAFLPGMIANGWGRVINVASVAGVAPPPNMAAYAASKHAVIGLSEVLALELHGTPVSVLVVCPGIINTNIVNAGHMMAPGISEAQVQKLQRYYVEHGCLPDVVADGIVRSVLDDDPYLFVGPMAKLATLLAWLPRGLRRTLMLRNAGKAGYLP